MSAFHDSLNRLESEKSFLLARAAWLENGIEFGNISSLSNAIILLIFVTSKNIIKITFRDVRLIPETEIQSLKFR